MRWNSTYIMLKHLLPYRSTFSVFIGANYDLVNGEPLLSEGHWAVVEKIMEFFGIFYEPTVALSGVDYSNYFTEVRAELYKLYNKYENKYGAVRLQRPSNISGSSGKKMLGVRYMELLLVQVPLFLLLYLHLLLYLCLLFQSCLPTWTATLSPALMMILT